jgi:hypothetical protein
MQNLRPINVIKASGTTEPYSEEKVIRSLASSGLSLDTTSRAVDHLRHHLKPGISTDAIYGHLFSFLHQNAPVNNYFNYGLKRAVMAMGPSGFPFEILFSDILKMDGYRTEVGVVTQGKCVTHEVDVIALKKEEKNYIECKFHNNPGHKTDIQVALYTHSRFLDIDNAQGGTNNPVKNHSWLVTNTKVTSDVESYCNCVGQKVTTWTYPKGKSLQDMIVSSGLHPVTLLSEVPKNKIKFLLDLGIVTCSRLKTAILNNQTHDLLDENEKSLILKNIASICKDNG